MESNLVTIGSLEEASQVLNDDILLVEQNGISKKIKAGLLKSQSSPSNSINSLDNYNGANATEKLKALIKDVSTNYKNTSMTIQLPDGVTEINEKITFDGLANKTIICRGAIWFNGCDAFEFKKLQHSDIQFNRLATNKEGLISLSQVNNVSTTGIKFTDCSYNRSSINQIVGFVNGIELYSEYGNWGTFYNDFFLNAIWRCKLGIKLYQGSASDNSSSISGWVNENTFYGGMIDANKGIQIGQPLSSRPANEPQDNYHNNKFYGTGFEQLRDEADPVAIDMIQGFNNAFLFPRFEHGGYGGRQYTAVREGKDAYRNVYHTSGYPLEVSKVKLNTSTTKENGKNCQCQSYLIANFTKESAPIGDKMIALPGKLAMEATALSNYYMNNWALPNTFCYAYEDAVFAKYKDSNGVVKTINWS